MKTKPYKQENNQQNKASEPMAAYVKTEMVSIYELNIPSGILNELIERAESDFATGKYTTSADLLHKIKKQRGWL